MRRRSHFWVLGARFVFRCGYTFWVRGSGFGLYPTNGERSNLESRTEPEHERRTRRTQKRERYLRWTLLLTIVLALEGHPSSQGQTQTAAPTSPLTQTAYIKASNADAYDYFADGGGNQGHNGNSIAMSADGSTMAVGAPYESGGSKGLNGDQNDNSAYASGAVYIFVRQGASWTQQAYIKASNTDQSDHFGASVALSHDGHTLAVAAPWESSATTGVDGNQSDNSLRQAGAVYLFVRTGSTWTQQAYVKASNAGRAGEGEMPGDGDQFGYSLGLSGDGNTLAVAAPNEDSSARGIDGPQDNNDRPESGAAYFFTRTGSTWRQVAFVKGANSDAYDEFGGSVAVSRDGRTIVIGARGEDGGAVGVNGNQADNSVDEAGAVYVFTR